MDRKTFATLVMQNACGVHFTVAGQQAGIEPLVEDGVWYWQVWCGNYARELWGVALEEVMEMPLWDGRTFTALLSRAPLRFV